MRKATLCGRTRAMKFTMDKVLITLHLMRHHFYLVHTIHLKYDVAAYVRLIAVITEADASRQCVVRTSSLLTTTVIMLTGCGVPSAITTVFPTAMSVRGRNRSSAAAFTQRPARELIQV